MRPYVKHSLTNPKNIRIAASASLAINIGWLHLLSNWWLGLSGSIGNTANTAITLTLQPATISTAGVTSLQESSLDSDEASEPTVESSSAFAEQRAVDPPSERPNDARSRPRKATAMNSSVGELRLAGSGWQQRFELDGRCFEVQLADPLVSLSQDRWYRVACND